MIMGLLSFWRLLKLCPYRLRVFGALAREKRLSVKVPSCLIGRSTECPAAGLARAF